MTLPLPRYGLFALSLGAWLTAIGPMAIDDYYSPEDGRHASLPASFLRRGLPVNISSPLRIVGHTGRIIAKKSFMGIRDFEFPLPRAQ